MGHVINTIVKLIRIGISSPLKSLSYIRISKINVLVKAIQNESQSQILQNFRRNLQSKSPINDFILPVLNKKIILTQKKDELESFLKSDYKLNFKEDEPILSIILVFYNRAELSLACLQSIKKYANIPFELIIIDNASQDGTKQLLQKIEGAVIVKNNENLHFNKACNQAIPYLKGKYTLFLNNDTELLQGSIINAYEVLRDEASCGAIGAKIVLPNGKLQEAGSIIRNDGSCIGYGKGQSPNLSEFNFMRTVDYCSAAFLMTRTKLFIDHGGFDIAFEPAYYEETDFCIWLQKQGLKVVYNPNIIIRHFEFGSGLRDVAIAHQKRNQQIFFNKHKALLSAYSSPDSGTLNARFSSQTKKKKVLYIDDRLPHKDLGSGFPRANEIIKLIHELGYQLTIFPLNYPNEEGWKASYRDINTRIEIIRWDGINGFSKHLKSRKTYYDFIWISRPHNLQVIKNMLKKIKVKAKIIYDAEAIFAEREINRLLLNGQKLNKIQYQSIIKKELDLTKFADEIIVVSDADADKFKSHNIKSVRVLGHTIKIQNDSKPYHERKDLMFVGNLDNDVSPNVDSIRWFTSEVWLIIKDQIPNLKLHVIGSCKSRFIQSIEIEGIYFHGRLQNLSTIYANSRLFIAPSRYAAGIPYKIHEAASFGLPVVASELLGEQLGWKHQDAIMLSKITPDEFANAVITLYKDEQLWGKIQINALSKIKSELSIKKYKNTIAHVLS